MTARRSIGTRFRAVQPATIPGIRRPRRAAICYSFHMTRSFELEDGRGGGAPGIVGALRRALRRLRLGSPIVVVSGLPRSGTSMVMRMLAAGGIPAVSDGERAADEDNPLGYFELEQVKALGGEQEPRWLAAAHGRAVKVISFLLDKLPPGRDYRVVFLHRNLAEVLASQKKMLARRGETSTTSDERMTELFEEHLGKVRRLLREDPRFEALEVPYAEVIADPGTQAERIARFVGLPVDVGRMAAAVDPSLYRNRA